jgi:hypothetical protein
MGVAHAQYSLTLNGHLGHLVAHRSTIEGLRNSSLTGIDLTLSHRTNGSKDWHHQYKFPETGIYVAWWNLGNPEKLGSAVSVIPFIDFKVTGSKKSALNVQCGWGAGFLEKKFDADKNYKNTAIGSRLNNAILLHPRYRFALFPSIDLSLGLSLTHYSNGSFEKPNLGLNIVALTLGITGKFGKDTITQKPLEIKPNNKSVEWILFGSIFTKEVAPADGDKYVAITLMSERIWRRSKNFSYGFGGDLFYDHSFIQDENYNQSNGYWNMIRSGIHGTTEMQIGKTYLTLAMGAYLYSGVIGESMYHRFGIRHRIKDNWLLCMHVKSHWAKADFMEIGIARSWNRTRPIK